MKELASTTQASWALSLHQPDTPGTLTPFHSFTGAFLGILAPTTAAEDGGGYAEFLPSRLLAGFTDNLAVIVKWVGDFHDILAVLAVILVNSHDLSCTKVNPRQFPSGGEVSRWNAFYHQGLVASVSKARY